MTDPRLIPILPYVRRSHARFYPRGPFISITLAQWIIESAWGTAPSGRNNFFGIKATAAQIAHGDYTIRWTGETIHGVYQKIRQPFANFDSPADCFDAHAYLLCQPWYAPCQRAPNPDAYAHALWLCHYATGEPGHPYDQVLISYMRLYNLYALDERPPFVLPSNPES